MGGGVAVEGDKHGATVELGEAVHERATERRAAQGESREGLLVLLLGQLYGDGIEWSFHKDRNRAAADTAVLILYRAERPHRFPRFGITSMSVKPPILSHALELAGPAGLGR